MACAERMWKRGSLASGAGLRLDTASNIPATMKRRRFIAGSAAALAVPSVARSDRNSVLKYVPAGDLPSLDPVWVPSYETRCHGFMAFDTLYGQAGADQGFAATPQMIAGHIVEQGGKTWTLTLRDGLMFHDGTKVLARDCVASIRRWSMRASFGQTLMQRVDELTAPDDRTIVFRLNKPFILLPDALGKFGINMCAIMPERLASTDPFKPITEIIGSGPFHFSRRMSACPGRSASMNASGITNRGKPAVRVLSPVLKSCTSTESNGISIPIRPASSVRYRPGR